VGEELAVLTDDVFGSGQVGRRRCLVVIGCQATVLELLESRAARPFAWAADANCEPSLLAGMEFFYFRGRAKAGRSGGRYVCCA
jgi:hypothetical protein